MIFLGSDIYIHGNICIQIDSKLFVLHSLILFHLHLLHHHERVPLNLHQKKACTFIQPNV